MTTFIGIFPNHCNNLISLLKKHKTQKKTNKKMKITHNLTTQRCLITFWHFGVHHPSLCNVQMCVHTHTHTRLASWMCSLGSCTGPHIWKGSVHDLMLSCHLHESINKFWTRGPTFSFCTRPHKWCSDVVGPALTLEFKQIWNDAWHQNWNT